jgi:hypothetical protein
VSKGYSMRANPILGKGETGSHSVFGEKTFTRLFKTIFILIFIAAVLFSALIVPFFRESILTTVKNWFQIVG